MWFGLALLSALLQVLRNMPMKHLGRTLDDTINVWGRFTFLLPFVAGFVLWQGIPPLRPGFWLYVVLFGAAQTAATLSLAKALRLSDISIVTALWKVSLLFLVAFAFLSLGEMPSPLGLVGILVSLVGVYVLNIQKSRLSLWAPCGNCLPTAACGIPCWRPPCMPPRWCSSSRSLSVPTPILPISWPIWPPR